jgi:FkbM family methyltransferase
MPPFVSYAQNFEDVILWRALRHIEQGFYIDIGAYSPRIDSVTQAFYERGWRGINIEPLPESLQQFLNARPEDINLDVAVGAMAGESILNVASNPGLSTMNGGQAVQRVRDGLSIAPMAVRVETINTVWAAHVRSDQHVHFLKIDVEGHERAVLLGNDWKAHRPWITVVEATLPGTAEPSHESWEPILTDSCYRYVYFDGLNRFYLAEEHGDLADAFSTPPNVFDNFVRASEVQAVERAWRAEAELATVTASRSWRWTKPLRNAARVARRLRQGTWSPSRR